MRVPAFLPYAAAIVLAGTLGFVPLAHAALMGASGGSSTSVLNSLYCQLTGCTMTGTVVLPTKTCTTVELGFSGSSNTGICDNGGGNRPVWEAGGASIFEGSGVVGFSVAVASSFASTATLKKNLLSATSTTTNAGSGSCTSVTVAGTVLDFTITATCTAAQTVVTTFSDGFGAAPNCTISSANSAAGAVTTGTPYQSAGSTTSATFVFPAVTAGKYNVICAL